MEAILKVCVSWEESKFITLKKAEGEQSHRYVYLTPTEDQD